MGLSIVTVIIQVIFLEGVLSIDNAAVLGAMVAPLPDDIPVPWHRSFRRIGTFLHPLLGNQRTAALRVGLLGAYLGRATMLLLASIVIQNPWLKIIGAIYLIRLAFNNLGIAEEGEQNAHVHPINSNLFWLVVLNVEMADLIFSLDNVVAVVTLSNQLWVVMMGVAIGIVMMRFTAGWFSFMIRHEPVLEVAAYALVLIIGAELLFTEFTKVQINDWLRFGISVSVVLLTLAYAHSKLLQMLRPVFVWLAQGMANVNELIDWALIPVFTFLKVIGRGIKWFFSSRPKKASLDLQDQRDSKVETSSPD